jgi:ketosteroid isomerase-like protein
MSVRNIELQRRVVVAVNAREVPEEILAPGFWMENRASSVTDYTYHGAAGWRDWMNDIFEEFAPNARYQVEDILTATEDFVIAVFRIAGHSARSGDTLEFRWTGVTWFRDGQAARAVGYANRAEAFAAAAVEEAGCVRPAGDVEGGASTRSVLDLAVDGELRHRPPGSASFVERDRRRMSLGRLVERRRHGLRIDGGTIGKRER